MSDEKWVPLSVREGLREPFKPVTGMPDFLRPSIARWFAQFLDAVTEVGFGAIEDFDKDLQRAIRHANVHVADFTNPFSAPDDVILDVIDYLLFRANTSRIVFRGPLREISMSEDLERILVSVDHEYRLDADKQRLVKRVDETVWAAYERVLSVEDEASVLIGSAWAKQYSRVRDFAGAWEDANKAVTVLLRPIVSPRNAKATLSTMAREIRDGEHKFRADLRGSGVDSPVLQFARALDTVGYPPNHHDGSVVDGRMSATAVLQAVTVVGWLRDGAFWRVEEGEDERG